MIKKLFLFFLFVVIISDKAIAIGDDSSYHRYNPTWTRYFHPNNRNYLRVVDTSITLIHEYDLMHQQFGWMNLGVNATPGFKTFYRSQYETGLKWGMTESVAHYLVTPEELHFYNTVKPYTHLFYTSGSKNEQQLVGTHTQNFGRNINIGIEFLRHGVPGLYPRQHSNVSDIDVFADVNSKNQRYQISPYVILNRLNWELNGGINDDSVFTDPLLIDKSLTNVNLNNASASLRGNHYGAYHSYSWGNKYVTKINDTTYQQQFNSSIRLQHHIDYKKYAFGFTDDSLDFPFFQNTQFLSSETTKDTSSYSDLHNEISLKWENIKSQNSSNVVMRKFPFRIYASHDLHSFTYHSNAFINEMKIGFELSSQYSNVKKELKKLHFFLDASLGKISTRDIEYHLNSYLTYSSNSYQYLYFMIQTNRIPTSWVMNHYYSNHYFWNHSFTPATESLAELAFTNYHSNTTVGIKYIINKNPSYYSVTAEPTQYIGTLNGWCIYVSKNFKLGKFHWDNEIGINQLDEKIFYFPTYVGRHVFYFEGNLFKKALKLCTGLAINYVSDYYAPAFNPAMLTFYKQNNELMKYYPVADFFINLKVKSARIFLRLENLDQHLFAPGYFTAPNYPAADLNLKFGVSWMFWN